MDYFHQFGLAIIDLANPGDEAVQPPKPEEDKKSLLIHRKIPVEKTYAIIQAKEKFMKYITASLEWNVNMPTSSHCPIPEMKVNLPVPEGTVVYRRPCPYAQIQNSILNEAIEKWIRNHVITLAPVGNVHAKKDKKGNKTVADMLRPKTTQ